MAASYYVMMVGVQDRVAATSVLTDANGMATVIWDPIFPSVPSAIGCEVIDAAGGNYTATLISNSASGMTYQIKKQRLLPSTLLVLTALLNFDTFAPAPAGLTVFLSAKTPTQ